LNLIKKKIKRQNSKYSCKYAKNKLINKALPKNIKLTNLQINYIDKKWKKKKRKPKCQK